MPRTPRHLARPHHLEPAGPSRTPITYAGGGLEVLRASRAKDPRAPPRPTTFTYIKCLTPYTSMWYLLRRPIETPAFGGKSPTMIQKDHASTILNGVRPLRPRMSGMDTHASRVVGVLGEGTWPVCLWPDVRVDTTTTCTTMPVATPLTFVRIK